MHYFFEAVHTLFCIYTILAFVNLRLTRNVSVNELDIIKYLQTVIGNGSVNRKIH